MEIIIAIIGAVTGITGAITGILDVVITKGQAKAQDRSDRMAFLKERIFDTSIPKDLRLPFYEEYISMQGNGTAVKFWQLEEARERAAAIK
jgi:hypothetical protein